jgi:serine/threonine protein kinase
VLVLGECLSGRYRIERVLGKGGMGAVYLGIMDSLGGKKFAIKEMEFVEQGHRTKEQALDQFRKEASFLANLNHPNLVPVTDFFTDGGKHYLVMSYVEGQTLQERIEKLQKPLTWSEMKPRVDALLDVLNYLHTQNPPIIFRDLKPSNIMIEPSGHLRLIDFGIARTAQPGQETSTFLKGTGTSGFSPIEQYGMGETTDQRSDIYSFGATVYYLLTGRLPPDAVHRVSSGKPMVPPTELNPGSPRYLDGILLKCLAVRQSGRYNSVGEIRRELNLVHDTATAHETLPMSPVADMSLYSNDQGMVPGSRSSSSFGTLMSSLICLFAVLFIAFSWQDIVTALQPVEVVAQTEPEGEGMRSEPVETEATNTVRQTEDRRSEPPPPIRVVQQPKSQPRPQIRQPVASKAPAPQPKAKAKPKPKPKSKPKPKLDLGGSRYPKAPSNGHQSSQPQQPVTRSAPPPQMVFYEKLPDGRKVEVKPGDPRLPLLRRKWREQNKRR